MNITQLQMPCHLHHHAHLLFPRLVVVEESLLLNTDYPVRFHPLVMVVGLKFMYDHRDKEKWILATKE